MLARQLYALDSTRLKVIFIHRPVIVTLQGISKHSQRRKSTSRFVLVHSEQRSSRRRVQRKLFSSLRPIFSKRSHDGIAEFRTFFTAMSDFQAATERFLDWFKSVGGEFRDDLIKIQDLRSQGAGRGIGKLTNSPQEEQ